MSASVQSDPVIEPVREIVLLHGWGMHSGVWRASTPPPWGDWTPRFLDLPGHGGAPATPEPPDLWGWTDACLSAAPERAVWLGWSLGGLIALAAALRAPKRVAGLILLTATPRFSQAVDWTPAMPETTLAQFHQALCADPSGVLARFLALQVRGSDSARETLRLLRQILAERPLARPPALSLGLDLLSDGDLRGRLPDIRCPALWLFGSHDSLVPARVAERVETLMPGALTQVIQGAAHAPHLSHPEATAAAIGVFLDRLRQEDAAARGDLRSVDERDRPISAIDR